MTLRYCEHCSHDPAPDDTDLRDILQTAFRVEFVCRVSVCQKRRAVSLHDEQDADIGKGSAEVLVMNRGFDSCYTASE
jgi:hypothetical protein